VKIDQSLSITQADRQVGGSSLKSYLGKTLPSLLVRHRNRHRHRHSS